MGKTLDGHTLCFHMLEQHAFLFLMVAAISKAADKIDRRQENFRTYGLPVFQPVYCPL